MVEADKATTVISFPYAVAISDSANDTYFQLTIPFHVRPADAPGTLLFRVADECGLWVRREVKDSVPQPCIDQFVDTCGADVPAHSRDLCRDGEGDY
ncbi:hypothetical protein HPB50_009965 [Hyalomma asiaticum]|uniref:Uncharacterized protein n=1 Tax=Hyalomma asiaticum TaxID=266040 RepID=A0ACB7S3Z3_HYAAI|nr:hypothetical protein HPB50_009965 [Hyalomma asiaticum]